jgi:hypothetical protein
MKSEVQLNQNNIKVNDILIYSDASNFEKWLVTETFKGGFEAKNDFETKDFMFSELQYGWSISDKTKANNNLYFRTNYI